MILAQTHFTEAEMAVARRYHRRRSRVRVALLRVGGLVCLGFGAWCWYATHRAAAAYVVLMALGVLYLILPTIGGWLAARRLRAKLTYGSTIQWTFTEEELAGVTDGVRLATAWRLIFESVSTPDGHLIYVKKGAYFWVPRHGFATSSGDAELRSLLQAKTKHRDLA